MKCKTSDNGEAYVSATKITGKGDDGTKITGEEGDDAMKIVEEGPDSTKIAGEAINATEDQKAVSTQTTFVNHLFINCFNDHA
uniref:Uncharacterized protein n=1 Tax=Romanomermis culicivorax TaxID=13658 RepID=A0A915KER7_ROMCU